MMYVSQSYQRQKAKFTHLNESKLFWNVNKVEVSVMVIALAEVSNNRRLRQRSTLNILDSLYVDDA